METLPKPYTITSEEMAVYRSTARRREEQKQRKLAERRERAWKVARQAAALLKEHYGASRVVLFGSFARGAAISLRSDVDLAAWDLDERLHYRAISHLLSLDPAIAVDVVRIENAPPGLLRTIESEGVPL